MHTALRISATAIIAATGWFAGLLPGGSDTPAAASPVAAITFAEPAQIEALTVVGATDDQEAQLDETLAAFDAHGLELPPLHIEYFDDTDACEGNGGLYLPKSLTDRRVDSIHVCTGIELILVHELAHAWEHENLTDGVRHAFLDHWSLDTWNDHAEDWDDRGTEKAAHTVAYTVTLDAPTDNPDILQFVCGYELLTGNPLPHPDFVDC